MVRGPMVGGLDGFVAPGRHTRRAGLRQERPGLRRVAAAALVMLVLQYGLGMIVNFYVAVPAADAHAGIFTEIATAPLALTLHALLGVSLVGTAMLLVARAMAIRDRLLAALAAAGLVAIAGAFVAGEMFVKNGQDGTSFAMAMLTGVALLCYVGTLALCTKTRQAGARKRSRYSSPCPRPGLATSRTTSTNGVTNPAGTTIPAGRTACARTRNLAGRTARPAAAPGRPPTPAGRLAQRPPRRPQPQPGPRPAPDSTGSHAPAGQGPRAREAGRHTVARRDGRDRP